MGVNRCLRCVLCSIIKIDFFTLTFRQLERLVRPGMGGGGGESGVGTVLLAGKEPRFLCCWQPDSTLLDRWLRRCGC